eukprot:s238_g4.t1
MYRAETRIQALQIRSHQVHRGSHSWDFLRASTYMVLLIDNDRSVASEIPTRLMSGTNKALLAVQVALVSFESLLKISTFFCVSLSSISLLSDHAASTGHCEEAVLPASDMVPAIRSPEISHDHRMYGSYPGHCCGRCCPR